MKAEKWAAAGLVIALGAILLHVRGFDYDEVRRPVVVLGAAIALAAGASSIRGTSWVLRMSDLGLLALVLSSLFAVNRTEAAAALFPAAVAWIFLRATSLGWIPRPFLERWGLFLLSCVGVLFSGYGLCQFMGADFLGIGRGREAVSTLGNTNYAGVMSAVLALAGLAAACFEIDPRHRLLGASAALLGALHVAATGSLGGLIGLAAGVTVFAVLLVRRNGWRPASLIPLAILVVAIVPAFNRVSDRISAIARGEDRTSRVRLGLWKGTARLAADHPLIGCGAGNFRMAFPPYRDADERKLSHAGRGISYVEAEDPHQTYLSAMAEAGPAALISILAVLVLSVTAGFRRARDPAAGGLAVAATSGLVVLGVSALFNTLSGHLPFAVLAGMFAGAVSPATPGAAVTGRLRVAVIAVAGLLAVAVLPWFIADVRYRDAMHTSKPEERVAHAQAAVSALPGHWRARYQVALSWRALGEGEGTVRVELREILRVHPHHVAALFELAAGLTDAREEEALLRRAEVLAPEFVLVQRELAGVDLRRNDYASARRRVEKILETLPEEPDALFMIGLTWLAERKPEEALPWIRRAVAKNPKLRERLADEHPELKGDSRFSTMLGP